MIMVRFGLVASMVLKNAIHAKRAHTVYKQWPFYSIDREMADFLILISFPTFPNENKLIGLIVCVLLILSGFLVISLSFEARKWWWCFWVHEPKQWNWTFLCSQTYFTK